MRIVSQLLVDVASGLSDVMTLGPQLQNKFGKSILAIDDVKGVLFFHFRIVDAHRGANEPDQHIARCGDKAFGADRSYKPYA